MKSFDFIISESFYEIYENFKIGLKRRGLKFDDDIFSDSYLKCVETLKNKELTKKEAIKYLWVAYINRLKMPDKIKFESFDSIKHNIEDEEYDNDIDEIYNILFIYLRKNFSEKLIEAWRLHFEKGLTYKELKDMGYDYNFNPEFKKIIRYIRNKLLKDCKEYYELTKRFN